MKSPGIFSFIIVALSFFGCKPSEIILHGDITGIVTDAETSQPIQTATVILNTTNDTTSTNTDGSYLFKHLTPGEYEIQASKSSYADAGHCSVLYNDSEFLSTSANLSKTNGASIRCVKNPGK